MHLLQDHEPCQSEQGIDEPGEDEGAEKVLDYLTGLGRTAFQYLNEDQGSHDTQDIRKNGFKCKEGGGYPGWKPDLDSDILRIVKERWKELYDTEPEVKAIHAGLECGIIGEKFPGMDMVALGPQLEHPHSPEERVDLESMERLWKVVVAILEHKE